MPPEALAEDRRRAEAMVALVKEMTKGEDRRERLLWRARPSDQKTLLKRFERGARATRSASAAVAGARRCCARPSASRRRGRAAAAQDPGGDPTTSRRRRGLDFAGPRARRRTS